MALKLCHLSTRLIKGGADYNVYYNLLHAVAAAPAAPAAPAPAAAAAPVHAVLVVGAEYDPKLIQTLRAAGVRVEVIPQLRRSINPLSELLSLFALIRFFRRRHFDIVYTHNAKVGILGRFAVAVARRRPRPVVVHGLHGMSFTDTMSRPARSLFKTLERVAARHTDYFVSVGRHVRDLMLESGIGRPDQYHIIRSGMEIDRFAAARPDPALRRASGCSDRTILFLVVARLERRKGQHHFLDAFAVCRRLLSDGPPACAVLLGDGPELQALKRQAHDLGIADLVSFPGFRDNPEDYIAAADVVCLSSQWEGVPQSLVQAAAAGRPAVAFDVPGIREIVQPEHTGLVVPYGDIPAFAHALRRLAVDHDLRHRLGHNASTQPLDEYRLETMLTRTHHFIHSIAPAAPALTRR